MKSISRILSWTTKAATNVAQIENNLTAQHLAEHRIALTSTTSFTLDVYSFNENRLQTMFHGNYITGGVFNICLALAKNEVKSPEVDPKRKKKLHIIESDSSHESTTRYSLTRSEILSALEDKIRTPKGPCYIL